MTRLYLAAAIPLLAGCSATETTAANCTDVGVPAVSVTVVNAATGSVQWPAGLQVLAVSGAFRDSVRLGTSASLDPWRSGIALGVGRRGSFAIEVRADGFSTWRKDGVDVVGDECGHPITQQVVARLAPL